MKRTLPLLTALLIAPLAGVHTAEPMPEGVTLPPVFWDVDFNDNPLDAPPQPLSQNHRPVRSFHG